MKNTPVDSIASMPVRIPVSAVADAKWIQENLTDQMTKIPYGRIIASLLKKKRREMERRG